MMRFALAAILALPVAAMADGITIRDPMVPLAPPSARAHAAFMTLTNDGDTARHLVGASAPGYAMTQIHESRETDGIATMSEVNVIEIAPGQTVVFKPGGLHVMLMRPETPVSEGDVVEVTLEFADGTSQTVLAPVRRLRHGS
ncbi:MAG: copper chaperone PCu(A)C [Marinibacterium sp.]